MHRAFPLLGISVTAIFVTIQFSLPLSLGLLGALSIVRFRTPIKEPEEIGFIMLVIATSIAVATFKLSFVGVIFIVALAGLFGQALTRRFTGAESDGTIVISMPTNGKPADPAAITALLRKRLPKARLESVSQTDRETVVSYNFQGISDNALTGLQAELNAAAGPSTYNVFLNQTRRIVDASGRRIPSWLLIVATAAICVGTLKLESADLFPVWRFAVQWSPEALPSSRAVPVTEVASGVPVLSLTLEDADLNDPAKGLLPNKREHGEEWEREGSVSYFENGKLIFASGVGVRIHGGGSRITAPRPGFRLYFRRKYGPREAAARRLLQPGRAARAPHRRARRRAARSERSTGISRTRSPTTSRVRSVRLRRRRSRCGSS